MDMDELQSETAAAHCSREEAAFMAQDVQRLHDELSASEAAAAAAQQQLAALQSLVDSAAAGGGREAELVDRNEELQQELQQVRHLSAFLHTELRHRHSHSFHPARIINLGSSRRNCLISWAT